MISSSETVASFEVQKINSFKNFKKSDIQSFLLYLNLPTFKAFSLVSKEWNQVATSPPMLKRLIYIHKTFNPRDWQKFYPSIKIDPQAEMCAWHKFPLCIGKLFNSDCPIIPNKKFYETHFPIWIPSGLNLIQFVEALKINLPVTNNETSSVWTKGYGYNIFKDVIKTCSKHETLISRWLFLLKEVIPSSKGKNYSEQKEILHRLNFNKFTTYVFPSVLESVVSVASHFFKFNKYILEDCPTRCNDAVQPRVFVGSKEKSIVYAVGGINGFLELIGIAPISTIAQNCTK